MAEHAGGEVEHLAVAVNADGRPGNLVLGDQRGQLLGDPSADLIQIWHGATIGPEPGARFVRSDELRAARSSALTNLPPGTDLAAPSAMAAEKADAMAV